MFLGEGAIAVVLGNISGYPIGARLACELKENKQISKIQAERLISFTNNSSPLFVIGTVGVSMFYSKEIGLLLLITHLLASLSVGLIFRNWKKDKDIFTEKHLNLQKNTQTVSFSNFGEILSDSIKNAINLVLTIGGFIVLFSVVISILESANIFEILCDFFNKFGIPKDYSQSIFCGILELTNGLKYSTLLNSQNLFWSIVISSFILGFGGISVLLQVYSVIAKHGLSIKPYLYGKILQAIFATIYTIIALMAFPFLTYTI